MSRLRAPLRSVLTELSLEEHELERRAARMLARVERRRSRTVLVSCAASGLAVALLLALTGHWHYANHSLTTNVDPGPLSLSDRRAVADLDNLAPVNAARTIALSDGSRIVLDPETFLELLENDGQRFDLRLRSGRAAFDVRPDGPRRWIIESGTATVEVVGTQFVVERAHGRITVEVSRGAVLLRGDGVLNHVRRLAAGQRASIEDETAAATVDEPSAKPTETPTDKHRRSETRQRRPTAATISWHDLAHARQYNEAWALGRRIIADPSAHLSSDELLELADVARFAGSPDDAVALLARIARSVPRDDRAGLASFTRGRILDGDLHAPARAADAFAAALDLGLPQGLQEDAYERLVEAYVHANNPDAARTAAHEYDRLFPNGRLRARIDQLVTP